ncbi:hypothetical protein LCGC14_2977320 [marine sediment metagenome]|uniref:Ner winged helix-turn-helix DNA-binding domain-containing protein n=1 Tax=marine sediment metagenome TaxID=412755 RepID=A0A0F8X7M0_9ZZZZ
MDGHTFTASIFHDPRQRALWVLYQLRLRGKNFATIGQELGLSNSNVRDALFRPNYRVEQKLANILDVPIETLFPERYDAEGNRLVEVRYPEGRAAHRARKAKEKAA